MEGSKVSGPRPFKNQHLSRREVIIAMFVMKAENRTLSLSYPDKIALATKDSNEWSESLKTQLNEINLGLSEKHKLF